MKTKRIALLTGLAILAASGGLTVRTQHAQANVINDIKNAMSKIKNLGAQLAKFTTGEAAQVIAAFKKGPKGLLEFALNKMPGAIGKVVHAIAFGGGSMADRLKRAGEALLSELKKFVDKAKEGIKNGIDKVVKPLVAKAQEFIQTNVLKPALNGLKALLQAGIDEVASRAAEAILGKTDIVRGYVDNVAAALDAAASGDTGAVNAKLAAYNLSVENFGKQAVDMGLDLGLAWVRGKAVGFVMKNINKLMKKVWTWAYRAVSTARNAVQGAVGSVPFAGGVLAAAVGALIDLAWDFLKGKVDGFIEGQVNKLADAAVGKAKQLLAGVAGKAGGVLQGFVDAIKGPIQSIAAKVKTKIDPFLAKYRGMVAKLEKIRDRNKEAEPAAEPEAPAEGDAPAEEGGEAPAEAPAAEGEEAPAAEGEAEAPAAEGEEAPAAEGEEAPAAEGEEAPAQQ